MLPAAWRRPVRPASGAGQRFRFLGLGEELEAADVGDQRGLVDALRANPRTQHIPLVMITSAEERHREQALRAGVGLVMGKPYDEDALIAHIRGFKFFARAEETESLACA